MATYREIQAALAAPEPRAALAQLGLSRAAIELALGSPGVRAAQLK